MGDTASRLRAGYRALAAGDRQGLMDLLDPEVAWYPALGPLLEHRSYEGPEAVCAMIFDEIPSVIEGFTAEVVEIVEVDDDNAIAVVRFSGRVVSVDMQIEQTFAQFHRLRDGKDIEMKSYTTKREALEAIGLSE